MSTLTDIPELQYADIVAAARARLPALCPQWTDHGPADLGITLLELFAAISEMLRYRTRRETVAMSRAFLELLAGPDIAAHPDLAIATRLALDQIWTPYRAVTADDYESLTHTAWPASPEAAQLGSAAEIHHVHCLVERDVTSSDPTAAAPGHISLLVLPTLDTPDPTPLLRALTDFFEPRRLLATRHHVAVPTPIDIRITASIWLDDDVLPATISTRITDALSLWLDPHTGGRDGDGWPPGADVTISDLYSLLDGVPGVDFVTDVAVTTPLPARTLTGPANAAIGVHLDPHELPRLDLAHTRLRLHEPTGDTWKEIQP